MNGPQHYAEAERIADEVEAFGDRLGYADDSGELQNKLVLAQVHATLALAAATALNDRAEGFTPRELATWIEVAG